MRRERDALEQNCLEARAELAAMQVSLQQVSTQEGVLVGLVMQYLMVAPGQHL